MVAADPEVFRYQDRYYRFVVLIIAFLCYEIIGAWNVNLRSLDQGIKAVTPFLLLLFWPVSNVNFTRTALTWYAIATIAANAAVLPLEYGWTLWGGAYTFKGIYFFKTDLAYSVVTALLLLAILHERKRAFVVCAALLVGVMVGLSGSRLNYFSYAVVLAYILVLYLGVRAAGALGCVGVVVISGILTRFYSDEIALFLLQFDITDLRSFTRGRNVNWALLVNEGLATFDLSDILFGRGHYYDVLISAKLNPRNVHNAHNEVLYLLATRGMVGLLLYVALWLCAFRLIAARYALPRPGSAGVALAVVLFVAQGLTANVSEFTSKTWPLLFLMLTLSLGTPRQEKKR